MCIIKYWVSYRDQVVSLVYQVLMDAKDLK